MEKSAALLAIFVLASLAFGSFSGIARAQPWAARHGLTSSQFQAAFEDYVGQGYRLVDVSGYSVDGEDRYAAIWSKAAGPAWAARHGLTSSQFQAAFEDYVGQGYRLVDVSGYSVDGEDRYAAIWSKAAGPAWAARHGLTSSQFQAAFEDYVGQGYRLVDVSGYSVDGEDRYAAIWSKAAGPAWAARHGLTSSQFQAAFEDYVGQGYRLVDVSGYSVGGEDRYAAIWSKAAGPAWAARHGLTSSQFQAAFEDYVGQGYRLVDVSGYSVGGEDRYAAIWTKSEWSSADLLSIPELCSDQDFVNDPENRIYRGTFKGALETALVITPIEEEGKTVVFYLWGVEPKWDINDPGCTRALGTAKGKKLTVRLRGDVRAIYKFSGDKAKATVKYKSGGRVTPGKVTLSDS